MKSTELSVIVANHRASQHVLSATYFSNSGSLMELFTPRLKLKAATPQNLLALMESTESFESSFGTPVAKGLRAFFTSGEVSEIWLNQLRGDTEANVWVHGFIAINLAEKLAIGTIGFKGPPDQDGMVEIAYGIDPDYQNQGFATEAVAEATKFAESQIEVRILRAHTLPTDNASTTVLRKNGYNFVGEVVDPADGAVWRWERPKIR